MESPEHPAPGAVEWRPVAAAAKSRIAKFGARFHRRP
jgi:hypothetical protein